MKKKNSIVFFLPFLSFFLLLSPRLLLCSPLFFSHSSSLFSFLFRFSFNFGPIRPVLTKPLIFSPPLLSTRTNIYTDEQTLMSRRDWNLRLTVLWRWVSPWDHSGSWFSIQLCCFSSTHKNIPALQEKSGSFY